MNLKILNEVSLVRRHIRVVVDKKNFRNFREFFGENSLFSISMTYKKTQIFEIVRYFLKFTRKVSGLKSIIFFLIS